MSQSKASFNDYEGFVDKFKPKKTTDDCYTPPEIMDVVNGYVAERFGLDPATFVRPFWPGGDYEAFDYPDGCIVVDNPPFSMLAKIQLFYLERGIRFFLFAPALTCLSSRKCVMRVDHIVCDAAITYENGAVVRTGFVTNLDGEHVLESDPALGDAIKAANDARLAATRKTVPKYTFPHAVLTAARCQWMAAHHTPFKVRREDCCFIPKLDAMPSGIFGGGLLLSKPAAAERAAAERAAAERAAAERAAAERAAATVWELSEREERMQDMLGGATC